MTTFYITLAVRQAFFLIMLCLRGIHNYAHINVNISFQFHIEYFLVSFYVYASHMIDPVTHLHVLVAIHMHIISLLLSEESRAVSYPPSLYL